MAAATSSMSSFVTVLVTRTFSRTFETGRTQCIPVFRHEHSPTSTTLQLLKTFHNLMEISSIINAFLTMKMLRSSHFLQQHRGMASLFGRQDLEYLLPKYILRTNIFSLVSKRIFIFRHIFLPRFFTYSYSMPIINFVRRSILVYL